MLRNARRDYEALKKRINAAKEVSGRFDNVAYRRIRINHVENIYRSIPFEEVVHYQAEVKPVKKYFSVLIYHKDNIGEFKNGKLLGEKFTWEEANNLAQQWVTYGTYPAPWEIKQMLNYAKADR